MTARPGLSARQQDVLTRLETQKPAAIARALNISRQRVSEIIVKLERKGYVVKGAWGWEPTETDES